MTAPIILAGAGRMGGALLKGWIERGIGPLIVVEPKASRWLRTQAKSGSVTLHEAPAEVSSRPRACVIALKPQVLAMEAAEFRAIAQSGALMISIAAGTNIRSMRTAWGRTARIVRAMPNTPGAIGRGISALYAPANIKPADRKFAQALLAALGETLWVNRESLIDSVTAVSGSGPAYVFLLVEALAEAARAEGLPPSAANRLARATIAGAGALLETDERDSADLRKDVTSPGGTTEAALRVLLASDGLKPLLARAVRAARRRAEELAS
ncbi:MAG TPA: pyrroline-5-carboxylate reductase [Rhizomicrobium sp.]|nr:pyrroline-5-carboxylate reductase [Rhizomicrobium sp.]